MKLLFPVFLIVAAIILCLSSITASSAATPKSHYGGPVYTGEPDLNLATSFSQAGGGGDKFSMTAAITSMVGEDAETAEMKKLTDQYGKDKVDSWVAISTFAAGDMLRIANKYHAMLPQGKLSGTDLAEALVKAGMDKDGTFYTEYMMDKSLSHRVNVQIMDDIDARYGANADSNYHAITNQAMYDLAFAVGVFNAKLAPLH
jgi:hypothetical protein